ncbi:unnamed protein product [Clonostachys byssicola]|uniref:Uncharacterized protein n=1 Tax=Clonostachys byssicola TaxID=160290 RepID=A0A9N9UWS4_9HYPO|nr:unnamed protein product [Clonostachys byssicola]
MHLIKALISIFALSGSIAAQHTEEGGLTRRQELTAAREELLVARDNYLAVRDRKAAGKTAGKSAPKTGGTSFNIPICPNRTIAYW